MAEARRPPKGVAGSAMQQAVAAEQAARQAIVDAQAAASAAVEQARAQARAILNAVPARITRLRERGARGVEKALAQIAADEAAAAARQRETVYDNALLEQTVARLVERLTSPDPEEP